ncbi:D-glycero-alpha-D-manno-heptose-1,7-bisphosphate 7-phosphatase [Kibdelosporangium phytohabitans]|uniref:D,D-heptose 1,7-bisphosphate phosphatase n=1 Tax=Kibdelosporangium phytohabitans TaxID=860235 RepID=A0A0N9HYJ0_9PSEU|nr:HAD-IIIA family hydrolase [Kibdelosporangium phytohabitans]ALG10501.1 haloacid dehalogenase [Kibdelosporangium phytohabitans]MBE1461591.1 histidinol-phosphate phosphatase family protein [Kibdelosporangium phytohabitans]
MRPSAVLFDRDGTLIKDYPYNGDPVRVEPFPHAAEALARLRAEGVLTGVVTNQSGIARKLVGKSQVERVNARVEQMLGPFGTWQMCPHGPDDGCVCRKPAPGMIFAACAQLGVDPSDAVVIGDIESDVLAAHNAGARSILVPTAVTLAAEVRRAPVTAPDLRAAVEWVLS